jgi:SAM-dependent methyltransferase
MPTNIFIEIGTVTRKRRTVRYLTMIYNEAYRQYLEKWIDGINAELLYWDGYISSNIKNPSPQWQDIVSNKRIFEFNKNNNNAKTAIIDVGSGPFSSMGIPCSNLKVDFQAIDPLAYVYNKLKSKYGITTTIDVQFAFVERLTDKYNEELFDIVNMNNALDHAFDPVCGIDQMLRICKVGGTVILRHQENEAENENYTGFHQWNLCKENDQFIIWRPGEKIDITQLFSEKADCEVQYLERYEKTEGTIRKTTQKIIEVRLQKKHGNNNEYNETENLLLNNSRYMLDEIVFERLLESIYIQTFKTSSIINRRINRTLLVRAIKRIKCYGLIMALKYYAVTKVLMRKQGN